MPSIYTKTERAEFMQLYPKGCRRPNGYVAFFEWAEAQSGHGLKSRQCKRCKLWHFPQEEAAHVCSPVRRG